MTTLRTFQNEIDEIHNREVARQRAKVIASGSENQKEPKDQKPNPIVPASKGKAKDDGSNTAPTKPADSAAVIRASLLELEDRILV